MWKSRRNWQNASAALLFPDLLLLLLVLAMTGCVPVTLRPPKAGFENPLANLDTNPGKAYFGGYAAYQKGDQIQARKQFQKRLESSREYYPAYLAIAYTYLAEDNMNSAERYVEKALELAPDYPQAHYARAYLLEARQEYDASLDELDTVLRLNPDYPSAQQQHNIVRLKATELHLMEARRLAATDPEQALAHYKRVEGLASEIPELPLETARLLVRQGNCAEAVPYLRTAVERMPDETAPRALLADCLAELGELEETLRAYQELAALDPRNHTLMQKIKAVEKTIAARKLPEEYQAIPTASQATRAQLAALLVVELDFLEQFQAPGSEIIPDILDNWAQNYIRKVVDLGIMDLYPNRTFQPQQALTRVELAKAASRLLEILEAAGIKPPAYEPVSIPDLPGSNIYYSMVSKALSSGAISLDADGRFHPSRAVSGAEILSMVNRLKTFAE